ncbi:hypothetical protein BSKO_03972 [Bryopsis sp. KO-2023]|nr:hypothetical protein BSKO_03972 [Bryopsis sp. KO-2023]
MEGKKPIVFNTLDVREQNDGVIRLWGISDENKRVLVRVRDYRGYFFIPAPCEWQKKGAASESSVGESGRPSFDCDALRNLMNRNLGGTNLLVDLALVFRKPILFYRPQQSEGDWFLRLTVDVGGSVRRTAAAVTKMLSEGALLDGGFAWDDESVYEDEVKLLTRFLCDTSLSGSSWLVVDDYQVVPMDRALSGCDCEVICSWKSLTGLTPDIVQIADPVHRELHEKAIRDLYPDLEAPIRKAQEGTIPPFRAVALDVVIVPLPECSENASKSPNKSSTPHKGHRSVNPSKDPIIAIVCEFLINGKVGEGSEKVVFLQGDGDSMSESDFSVLNADVVWCGDERSLLMEWRDWVRRVDPDVFIVFEVKDVLWAIQERFKVLRLDGGLLKCSRLKPNHDGGTSVKNVVMYSTAWVKSQARMASTSNQETWRADIEGRMVFDVVRHALTALKLASFSLMDCVFSVLGERLEVLSPKTIGQLWQSCDSGNERDAFRLCQYCIRRVSVVRRLSENLGILTEAIEMARVTGLTLPQVMYNAQMIRTWSLLIRHAHQNCYIIGGRLSPLPLSESPYMMHPVELRNVGLYKDPVVILDFASLYPSLYCAYNMCYSTLLHPDDIKVIGEGNVTVTPTGAAFVKSDFRKGVLPSLLSALMIGRAETRQKIKKSEDAVERLVLDGRQKALKTVANAMYGFTGAQASPLQCVPLADSCLALGASTCKRAREVIEDLAKFGALGEPAKSARVIYAQTDSLFALIPDATAKEALDIGAKASEIVSMAFPPEINLKFENVMCPFLLLHVNRYAGCAFETKQSVDAKNGKLVVKGLKSMWRQAPPVVRNTLQGAITQILMEGDVTLATKYVKQQVKKLLTGEYGIWHLIMTGGLWRVTGSQIENAAALESNPTDEEVRGPHASLAVRIQQRDPTRKFSLGERLQYVILSGHRTQDDAAEDPLTALMNGLTPDFHLYWKNKLMRPLTEIFSTCLDSPRLQDLLSGPHTLFHVNRASAATMSPQSQSPAGRKRKSPMHQTGLTKFFKQSARCLGCRKPMKQDPSRIKKNSRVDDLEGNPKPSLSAISEVDEACTPPRRNNTDADALDFIPVRRGPELETGDPFKTPVRGNAMRPSCSPSSSIFSTPRGSLAETEELLPGLCQSCASSVGKWEEVQLKHLASDERHRRKLGIALSDCVRCHSGGQFGEILCENAECPVLYERIEQGRKVREEQLCLHRLALDW